MKTFQLQHNKKVVRIFLELVRELNRMSVTPIVYGSLGLALFLGERGRVNDIDIILSNANFRNHWNDIYEFLTNQMRYVIDPEHKQEFIGRDIPISFITVDNIRKLVAVNMRQLKKITQNGATYYNLSLSQHLAIYTNGLLNKFRRQKRGKDDREKIRYVRQYVAKKNGGDR